MWHTIYSVVAGLSWVSVFDAFTAQLIGENLWFRKESTPSSLPNLLQLRQQSQGMLPLTSLLTSTDGCIEGDYVALEIFFLAPRNSQNSPFPLSLERWAPRGNIFGDWECNPAIAPEILGFSKFSKSWSVFHVSCRARSLFLLRGSQWGFLNCPNLPKLSCFITRIQHSHHCRHHPHHHHHHRHHRRRRRHHHHHRHHRRRRRHHHHHQYHCHRKQHQHNFILSSSSSSASSSTSATTPLQHLQSPRVLGMLIQSSPVKMINHS